MSPLKPPVAFFPKSTILSCFFLFFFIIDLYFLVPAMNAQILIPIAELVVPTGTQTNEANADTEAQGVIFEARISKCSTWFKYFERNWLGNDAKALAI